MEWNDFPFLNSCFPQVGIQDTVDLKKLILEVASTDSQGKRWIFKSIQAGWLWCHVFGDRIHS